VVRQAHEMGVLTRIRVKQSVGAATLLLEGNKLANEKEALNNETNLIHILAKQDTPMNVRRTILGRVPARLRMRVINTRSMFVLLRADEIVKPPMSNIIVGENIMENTYLK
jgi:hypothetical protein